MAQGTLVVFDEAKAYMIDGGWEAADDIKCAILTNATAPLVADAAPLIGDYTQVTNAGTYTTGGDSLGNLGTLISEAAGVMKADSATNPVWLKNASNGTDAYWAYVYHVVTGLGIFFVDLDGAVDMTAGDLTITWNGSGMFTTT